MRELRRTNDLVYLTAALAALRAEGVAAYVLDAATSVMEGSIGAIPRRLMVSEADVAQAELVLSLLEQSFGEG